MFCGKKKIIITRLSTGKSATFLKHELAILQLYA